MRGKDQSVRTATNCLRITPAYAGKSQFGSPIQFQSKDHPRLCGEKFGRIPENSTIQGSPPPMRGKVVPSTPKRKTIRITPAYAGKSFLHEFYNFFDKDHPRLCGEKVPEILPFSSVVGSPPPMRGKAGQPSKRIDGAGITPAYAGKSHLYGIITVEVRDHPRLCGEKILLMYEGLAPIGSPPPMRGKG